MRRSLTAYLSLKRAYADRWCNYYLAPELRTGVVRGETSGTVVSVETSSWRRLCQFNYHFADIVPFEETDESGLCLI